jgi:hypothetical protein
LRVPERITFKICSLVYRSLDGTAPPYLSELIQLSINNELRRHLRYAGRRELIVLSLVAILWPTDPVAYLEGRFVIDG